MVEIIVKYSDVFNEFENRISELTKDRQEFLLNTFYYQYNSNALMATTEQIMQAKRLIKNDPILIKMQQELIKRYLISIPKVIISTTTT